MTLYEWLKRKALQEAEKAKAIAQKRPRPVRRAYRYVREKVRR